MATEKLSDEAILAFLQSHPGFREGVASIVGALGNLGVDLGEADAAEARLVEEIRKFIAAVKARAAYGVATCLCPGCAHTRRECPASDRLPDQVRPDGTSRHAVCVSHGIQEIRTLFGPQYFQRVRRSKR
jgi:hypothetical protein